MQMLQPIITLSLNMYNENGLNNCMVRPILDPKTTTQGQMVTNSNNTKASETWSRTSLVTKLALHEYTMQAHLLLLLLEHAIELHARIMTCIEPRSQSNTQTEGTNIQHTQEEYKIVPSERNRVSG